MTALIIFKDYIEQKKAVQALERASQLGNASAAELPGQMALLNAITEVTCPTFEDLIALTKDVEDAEVTGDTLAVTDAQKNLALCSKMLFAEAKRGDDIMVCTGRNHGDDEDINVTLLIPARDASECFIKNSLGQSEVLEDSEGVYYESSTPLSFDLSALNAHSPRKTA